MRVVIDVGMGCTTFDSNLRTNLQAGLGLVCRLDYTITRISDRQRNVRKKHLLRVNPLP